MMKMSDMEKCTVLTRNGDSCSIECIYGLWEVTAQYGIDLVREASHYFEQYKSDGEYYKILGGKSPVELMMGEEVGL